MKKGEIKNRIEKLKKEINYHRYQYHVLDKQEISESALDSLKNELAKLEQENPEYITLDSPTQRVGGLPLDKFQKVTHSSLMFSLFDAFTEKDMRDWEERINKKLESGIRNHEYYVEIKLDGLAVALRYEKGIFAQGATRGDGRVGEDVTNNLKTIESTPLSLRIPEKGELKKIGLDEKQIEKILKQISTGQIEARGEVIMTKKVFEELNKKYKKQGKQPLSNPRNGAAGSIRQLDPKVARERKLDFYVYSLNPTPLPPPLNRRGGEEMILNTHEQEHELARLLGFKVIKENKYCQDLDEVIKFHTSWEKKRDSLPFEFDGLVIKVNDLSLWPKLGIVGKGPRFMMAYKFTGEQVATKVKDVVWQVGRTGILTPTAVLEPTRVGGVTVSHATLHNMDEIKRLGIKIEDTVIIERAGDVIPKVVQALPKLRTGNEKIIKVPEKCPICSSKVEKILGEVAYRCTNKDCYAVNLRRLEHWVSKGAVDIEGLGPKIIEQLVKEGLISDIADFYSLTEGDLKPLERFADKSAVNLINSISSKKEIELSRYIYGLGIRHVGEESALLLAKKFGSIEKIKNATLEDLVSIHDFGEVMAKSVYDWFRDKKNIKLLDKLEKAGVGAKSEHLSSRSKKLENKTFVLTGTLENLTRQEAKAKIRAIGGKIASSVSKNTDFVVTGSEPGSKYEKAKKLGVKIIKEQDLVKMI
jgi:DNA ligase (NAD+)